MNTLESLECWISKCLSTVFMFSLLNSFRDNNSIYKYFHNFLVLKTIIVENIFDYGSVGLVPLIGIYASSVKVHIFWEGHKILQNLHHTFVLCSASQK